MPLDVGLVAGCVVGALLFCVCILVIVGLVVNRYRADRQLSRDSRLQTTQPTLAPVPVVHSVAESGRYGSTTTTLTRVVASAPLVVASAPAPMYITTPQPFESAREHYDILSHREMFGRDP